MALVAENPQPIRLPAIVHISNNAAIPVINEDEPVNHMVNDLESCKTGEPPSEEELDWEVSLCPWKYKTDEDPSRIPEIITHAVCQCKDCHLSRLGLQHDTGKNLRGKAGCREIYKPLTVLHNVSTREWFLPLPTNEKRFKWPSAVYAGDSRMRAQL